jgi:hypothetical protein
VSAVGGTLFVGETRIPERATRALHHRPPTEPVGHKHQMGNAPLSGVIGNQQVRSVIDSMERPHDMLKPAVVGIVCTVGSITWIQFLLQNTIATATSLPHILGRHRRKVRIPGKQHLLRLPHANAVWSSLPTSCICVRVKTRELINCSLPRNK